MLHQIDLSEPVSVTLPLGAWNTILSFIAKRSWDEANPLMQAIQSQLAAPAPAPERKQNVVPIDQGKDPAA